MKLFRWVRTIVMRGMHALEHRLGAWTKPPISSLAVGSVHDLTQSKVQVVIENAVLRQQRIVLNRSVHRSRLTNHDRGMLVLLASRLHNWPEALIIVKPETILRWHRLGFRLFWKRTSVATSWKSKIPAETITVIQAMATDHRRS